MYEYFIEKISIIMLTLIPMVITNGNSKPQLFGFTVHFKTLNYLDGVVMIPAMTHVKMTFYGRNLSLIDSISFTTVNGSLFSFCDHIRSTKSFPLVRENQSASTTVTLRPFIGNEKLFYICVSQRVNTTLNHTAMIWRHQGFDKHVTLKVFESKISPWLMIVLLIFLFSLSGLFSGLNLGLMSLSLNDLQLFLAAGSPKEKQYAKIITPVRNHGNFLLATLLLGNVLVNSALTILVDALTGNGLLAVIGSTLGIVIFGEIIPQSVTSRHALVIGAKTMWITKLFMVLTFVLSFPIGKLLDRLLGKELGVVYSREKLEILVKQQQLMGAVVKDEVNIITGALNLTTKTAKDIMTHLDNAFMIPYSSILNFDLLNQIVRNGFSRIPVYEGERHNIKAVLNIKDLTLLDPDENISLATVCSFYKRPIMMVSSHTILRDMLEEFKKGKTHLAFVSEIDVKTSSEKIIGLVTLEDVIEEIIQAEIVDETDIYIDNMQRTRRSLTKQDFSIFDESNVSSKLAPHLKLTALQHLYSAVSSFREDLISFNVLKSLLNANIVREFNYSIGYTTSNIIIPKDKVLNCSIMILSGRVSVSVSHENLYFECGPYMFFGETILKNINFAYPVIDLKAVQLSDIVQRSEKNCCFTPDYSVSALSNVQYLEIKIEHYVFARYLSQRKTDPSNKNISRCMISFQDEWNLFTKKEQNKFQAIDSTQNNNNFFSSSDSISTIFESDEIDYSDREPLL